MRAAIIAGLLVALASLAAFGMVKVQKSPPPATKIASNTQPPVPTAASAESAPSATRQQVAATQAAPPPAPAAAAPAPAPTPVVNPNAGCTNPNAIGIARVVEIDTTGGPGFGFEHFKSYDFLRPGEVVLTFDDGPWLNNTPMVLKALADQCVKATFFPIGKHATYYPEILKQVFAAGHTIGSHTWSHATLSKKTLDEAKEEIEKGISAVKWAVGAPTAPFFRFPALQHPPEVVTYLGERNIGIFSTDMDSFDFKIHKPEQVIKSVMDKLKKHGKGIVLLHDFQAGTAHAVPQLLAELKANGYKIVHLRAKDTVQTIAQFDEAILKDQKIPTLTNRPTSSVIRTIEGQ